MNILDSLRGLLQGETARAIGYGAGVAVYLVAALPGGLANIPLDTALAATAAYVTIVGAVVETIRHFVYSPQTASDLLDMISELEDELQDLRTAQGVDPRVPDPVVEGVNGTG